MLQNEKGKTLLQCRFLSLTCEQNKVYCKIVNPLVGLGLNYDLSMYINIVLTSVMRATSKKTGKVVRCQLRPNNLVPWDVWVGESERAPTSAPCRMDGWMMDGWMDRWMDDENNTFFWVDSMSHIQLWWLTMY
jgi:hypothetical protein